MINVTVQTTKRNTYIVDENSTVNDLLDDKGISTNRCQVYFNGICLEEEDLDSTFDSLGVRETNRLSIQALKDNA